MDKWTALGCFLEEWTSYLELHGHRVSRVERETNILRSRDARGQLYRWLLQCADADSLLLSAAERKYIRAQNRLAQRAGERCFVVVKFGYPGGKAVIVPATHAHTLSRVSARTAGIPWDAEE